MTISSLARLGAVVGMALVGIAQGIGPVAAEDPPQAELDAIREALSKYKDPYVAVRDLYLSTVACVPPRPIPKVTAPTSATM